MKYLFILIFSFYGCGLAPKEFNEFSLASNAEGVPFLWDKNVFPINLKIDESFTQNEVDAIKEMSSNWNSVNANQVQFLNNNHKTAQKNTLDVGQFKDTTMGIYKITNWSNTLPPTALAVTQLYGHMRNNRVVLSHADILINYENFSFSSSENSFGYDLKTVVIHEMGHFLGLRHNDLGKSHSVMYPSIGRLTVNQVPKEYDHQKIKEKYFPTQNISLLQQRASNNDMEENSPVKILLYLKKDGTCKNKLHKHH